MTLLAGSSALSAAPPIETQLINELHELKNMLHRVSDVLAQISQRIEKLERQM